MCVLAEIYVVGFWGFWVILCVVFRGRGEGRGGEVIRPAMCQSIIMYLNSRNSAMNTNSNVIQMNK